MSALRRFRRNLTGIFGKWILWLWAKSARTTVLGEDEYKKLRSEKKPVIILIWHGRLFFAPYFFRRRGIMPLVSPSEDGEIIAQIGARWGYKLLRGSSSHSIIKAWNEMKKELEKGGEVIIVPDGPRGPGKKMKPGAVKLAKETGAYLNIPATYSHQFICIVINFLNGFDYQVHIRLRPHQYCVMKTHRFLDEDSMTYGQIKSGNIDLVPMFLAELISPRLRMRRV